MWLYFIDNPRPLLLLDSLPIKEDENLMDKLKPALLGGLVVGLLSSIPLVNYCCCLWGVGGGLLAGFRYVKDSPTPVRPGDGAIIGGLAGVIGGLLYLIIGVPIAYFVSGGGAQVEEALRQSGVEMPISGLLLFIVSGLVGAGILIILSVVGGLLSIPIFEKRKDGTPPPPPPPINVGGEGPGGYAA